MARARREGRKFASRLLEWFEANGRDSPWRDAKTAYEVTVAEALLQKTAAQNALPIFEEVMERYPDVWARARAR